VAQYVYGIVEATATAPRGRGIAGSPLRLIVGDDAAALVSEIAGDSVRLGREEILVHARVLERALKRGVVLPMRFGVVMSGADEVRSRLLDEHGPDLKAQLSELDGKVEIRIRAVYEQESMLRDLVRDNPQIAGLRAAVQDRPADASYYERIRLGELVASAMERRRERDGEAIVDALSAASLAVEVGEPTHERVVVQASFLVERARQREFDQTLDGVANGYGGQIRFKYTGPLPPHSFVELAQPA
jgi:Gas vesicle synthesis protein GvpL/GvpF